jgi:hypothetical protein
MKKAARNQKAMRSIVAGAASVMGLGVILISAGGAFAAQEPVGVELGAGVQCQSGASQGPTSSTGAITPLHGGLTESAAKPSIISPLRKANAAASEGREMPTMEQAEGPVAGPIALQREAPAGPEAVVAENPLTWTSAKVASGAGGAIVGDDGRFFAGNTNLVAGDEYDLLVGIGNSAEDTTVAQLTVQAPEGFLVNVEAVKGSKSVKSVVQTDESTWLVSVAPGKNADDEDLHITLSVKKTVAPGKGKLSFSLTPFARGV